jgi:hypothetical protein
MMLSRALRSKLMLASAARLARPLGARSLSTFVPDQEKWQKEGFMDEQGLTVFETLHEMVDRSTQVFGPKHLFGTYSETSKEFEWQTFSDYRQQIDECRAVLKNLGKCRRGE